MSLISKVIIDKPFGTWLLGTVFIGVLKLDLKVKDLIFVLKPNVYDVISDILHTSWIIFSIYCAICFIAFIFIGIYEIYKFYSYGG
jgi:hypothetical protein